MFVKLYSRITESSLMEQPVEIRYTFLMLLAIADPKGLVVGTDIAIARRLNVPVEDFVKFVKVLGEPDADSNSKEEEGRRVLPSDGERGYQLVNFLKYRNLKDEDEKREYMREYMRNRRLAESAVKNGKVLLNVLTNVTQAEAEAEAEATAEVPPISPTGDGRVEKTWEPSAEQLCLNSFFKRRTSTAWSKAEVKAFKAIGTIDSQDLQSLDRYYKAKHPPDADYRRHDLITVLNNWNGELDRARKFKPSTCY